MSITRQVLESPLVQGVDETIIYSIRTTPWGAGPGSVAVEVYDVTGGDYTDVTSSVVTGSPSVLGDVITLPQIGNLEENKVYKVEVYFEAGSQEFECYFLIEGEL